MKKFLAVVLTLCALASVMFFGCRKLQQVNNSSSAVLATPQTATSLTSTSSNEAVKAENKTKMPKKMQQVLAMGDKELSENFAAMDIVLGDSFLFEKASALSSEELYEFYRYIVQTDEYPHDYLEKYRVKEDKTGNQYKIPVKEINKVLSNYFDGTKFDPSKVTAAENYDKKNGILKVNLMGCGGMRFARVCIKEAISDDTLKISVDYFNDNSYSKVDYTKIYIIKFTDSGYKYVSVVNR